MACAIKPRWFLHNLLFISMLKFTIGYSKLEIIRIFFEERSVSLVNAYTCWNKDETKKFIKTLSKYNIRAAIRNKKDNVAIKYFREGFFVDTKCSDFVDLLENSYEQLKLTSMKHWLLIQYENGDCENNYQKENITELSDFSRMYLSKSQIYPNSHVYWAQYSDCNKVTYIFDIYRISLNRPIRATYVAKYPTEHEMRMGLCLPSLGHRRGNLEGLPLKAAYVLVHPDKFTTMDDVRTKHIDPTTKSNYPLVKQLSEDLNFKPKVQLARRFGWIQNGTYDGLLGLLQRREIVFGMSGVFMRKERLDILHFTFATIPLKSRILFRQPALSIVSDIFTMPFSTTVWFSCLFLYTAGGIIIILQIWVYHRFMRQTAYDDISITDSITFVLGAICQQGHSIASLGTISLRISVLFLFVASLFLFNSYSASIVALLQTPSKLVKTLSDLVNSPLTVGVENITYNYIYFAETNYSITRQLYKRKIEPQGSKAYMSAAVGVERIRKGMFAFQVDINIAYDLISNTFTENEKCGLSEVGAFELPTQTIPMVRNSPYRDLFTERLRWQRENGVYDRTRKRWSPQKPMCQGNQGGFVSVGVLEIMPSIRILLIGFLISIGFFISELILHNYKRIGAFMKYRKWRLQKTVTIIMPVSKKIKVHHKSKY